MMKTIENKKQTYTTTHNLTNKGTELVQLSRLLVVHFVGLVLMFNLNYFRFMSVLLHPS